MSRTGAWLYLVAEFIYNHKKVFRVQGLGFRVQGLGFRVSRRDHSIPSLKSSVVIQLLSLAERSLCRGFKNGPIANPHKTTTPIQPRSKPYKHCKKHMKPITPWSPYRTPLSLMKPLLGDLQAEHLGWTLQRS